MTKRIVLFFCILFLSLRGIGRAESPPIHIDVSPFLGGVASHTDNTLTNGVGGGFYLSASRGDLFGDLYFRTTYDKSSEKIDSDRSRFWYELEADVGDSWVELTPPAGWRRSHVGWVLGVHAVSNSTYVDDSLNINLGPSWSLQKEHARISLGLGASYYDYLLDDEPARDNGYERDQNDFDVHGGYLRLDGVLSFPSGSLLSGLAQTIVDQYGNLFESRLLALYDHPLSDRVTLRIGVEQRFFDLGSRKDILDFDSETLGRLEVLFPFFLR